MREETLRIRQLKNAGIEIIHEHEQEINRAKSATRLPPSDFDRMYRESMRWLSKKNTSIDHARSKLKEEDMPEQNFAPELINPKFTKELALIQRERLGIAI